jgi:hypothetical protein
MVCRLLACKTWCFCQGNPSCCRNAGFRNIDIDRAKAEIAQLQVEILQLEKRFDTQSELLRKANTELFGPVRPAFPALQEAALASRVAEAVRYRLSSAPKQSTDRRNE